MPHDAREFRGGKHQDRKDEVMGSIEDLLHGGHGVEKDALGAASWEPSCGCGEHECEQGEEHFRNGESDKGDERAEAIHDGIFSDGGDDSEWDSDRPSHDGGEEREEESVPETAVDEFGSGAIVGDGISEITAYRVPKPVGILEIPGLIEVRLGSELFNLGW